MEFICFRNLVRCNIPKCNEEFDTIFAYENHYNALHRFLCAQCSKNLPSAHLLDLHLSEKHDSFFAVQAERKPMVSDVTLLHPKSNKDDFIFRTICFNV